MIVIILRELISMTTVGTCEIVNAIVSGPTKLILQDSPTYISHLRKSSTITIRLNSVGRLAMLIPTAGSLIR